MGAERVRPVIVAPVLVGLATTTWAKFQGIQAPVCLSRNHHQSRPSNCRPSNNGCWLLFPTLKNGLFLSVGTVVVASAKLHTSSEGRVDHNSRRERHDRAPLMGAASERKHRMQIGADRTGVAPYRQFVDALHGQRLSRSVLYNQHPPQKQERQELWPRFWLTLCSPACNIPTRPDPPTLDA
jgi:hypothetical protein